MRRTSTSEADDGVLLHYGSQWGPGTKQGSNAGCQHSRGLLIFTVKAWVLLCSFIHFLLAGDIVTVVLDLAQGQISYLVNDEDFGVAFEGVDTSKTYFPAISMVTKQQVRCGLR